MMTDANKERIRPPLTPDQDPMHYLLDAGQRLVRYWT